MKIINKTKNLKSTELIQQRQLNSDQKLKCVEQTSIASIDGSITSESAVKTRNLFSPFQLATSNVE